MKFKDEYISTEILFEKPVNIEDLGRINRDLFTTRKRFLIAELHPRQPECWGGTINYKLKGINLTKTIVCITPLKQNVIMDGHHTTIAKKIKGQKYIYAYCHSMI